MTLISAISPISKEVINDLDQKISDLERTVKSMPSRRSFLNSCKRSFWKLIDKVSLFGEGHLKKFERNLKERDETTQFSVQLAEINEVILHKIIRPINEGKATDSEIVHEKIDKVYFEILPMLTVNPFSVSDVKPEYKKSTKENLLPKEIQNYLSADLKKLRAEKENDPQTALNQEHKLSRKIEKANLAIKMKRGRKPNVGTTGSEKLETVFEKTVIQFKKSYELTPFITKLLNKIKKHFGQISCLIRRKMTQPINETMAYRLSRDLGFNVVPATKLAAINKTPGMAQLWTTKKKENGTEKPYILSGQNERNLIGVDEVLLRDKEEYTPEENFLFQKFAIFDFLIGNLDRHFQNWMIIKEGGQIKDIVAIDNANAFPTKNAEPFFFGLINPGKNQYLWKDLNISENPFTEETIKFINENLSEGKINQLIESLEKPEVPLNPEPKTYLTDKVKALILERAGKIRKAANEHTTLRNLTGL